MTLILYNSDICKYIIYSDMADACITICTWLN